MQTFTYTQIHTHTHNCAYTHIHTLARLHDQYAYLHMKFNPLLFYGGFTLMENRPLPFRLAALDSRFR